MTDTAAKEYGGQNGLLKFLEALPGPPSTLNEASKSRFTDDIVVEIENRADQ